jgi:hypothetical protein
MTPSGIDPATFRLVAQCLNHCATACPQKRYAVNTKKIDFLEILHCFSLLQFNFMHVIHSSNYSKVILFSMRSISQIRFISHRHPRPFIHFYQYPTLFLSISNTLLIFCTLKCLQFVFHILRSVKYHMIKPRSAHLYELAILKPILSTHKSCISSNVELYP